MKTYEIPDERRCIAKSKRSQKRCKNPAVYGWRVCRMHGAGAGRPPSSGLYSRHLKKLKGIAKEYEEARKDGKLKELTDDLALTHAFIVQTLEKISNSELESRRDFHALRDSFLELKEAILSDDKPKIAGLLASFSSAFEKTEEDFKARHELFELMDFKRKLLETENKRLQFLDSFMDKRQAMALIALLGTTLVNLIDAHIEDERKRAEAKKQVINTLRRHFDLDSHPSLE